MASQQVIFSIMIGIDPMFDYAKKMLKQYAKKTNSDLLIIETLLLSPPHQLANNLKHSAWYQKKYILQLLKKYQRVLYMDADIVITPHADNIFESYPDEHHDQIFMLNERNDLNKSKGEDNIGEDEIQRALTNFNITPEDPELQAKYFNAGVILIGHRCPLLQNWEDHELLDIAKYSGMYEQTYINYLAIKNNIEINELDRCYNRMGYLGLPDNWNAICFIHFAAGRYYGSKKGSRSFYFRRLYLELYRRKESLSEKLKFYIKNKTYRLQRFIRSKKFK